MVKCCIHVKALTSCRIQKHRPWIKPRRLPLNLRSETKFHIACVMMRRSGQMFSVFWRREELNSRWQKTLEVHFWVGTIWWMLITSYKRVFVRWEIYGGAQLAILIGCSTHCYYIPWFKDFRTQYKSINKWKSGLWILSVVVETHSAMLPQWTSISRGQKRSSNE